MGNQEQQREEEKPFPWRPVWVGASIALITAILLAGVVVYRYRMAFPGPVAGEHDVWGQFGDYVGGVLNPMFAFLSFGALLLALMLQSRELHDSTEQLKKSAKALTAQHDVLKRQSFENTYFQMLRRVGEIISEMHVAHHVGRGVLSWLYDHLGNGLSGASTDEEVKRAYSHFYKGESHLLGHYFRTLYHVFTLVDKADLDESDKIRYANIARAQLSDTELCLLFYNGITGEGEEGFKRLIERYGLLKHVKPDRLKRAEHRENRAFYSPTAFMSADERKAFRTQQHS